MPGSLLEDLNAVRGNDMAVLSDEHFHLHGEMLGQKTNEHY
jgi:hypothetical protein